MLLASLALAKLAPLKEEKGAGPISLELQSPFSLRSALKLGLIFLAMEVIAMLASMWLGQFGFYAVSVVGGFVSSASAVASAASLEQHGRIIPAVAGTGAVLATLASALVNLPLVARVGGHRPLTWRLVIALSVVGVLGILGAVGQQWVVPLLPATLPRLP